MKATIIRRSLFALVLLALLLPVLQEKANLFRMKPLKGYSEPAPVPEFCWKSWLSEDYQAAAQRSLTESAGFREFLVRFYNQLDYSLFNLVHTRQVVTGKQHFLYEENYIRDYTGENFIGEEQAWDRLARIRLLQDELGKRKVDLVVVFAPGKASFYPEYIPAHFQPGNRAMSNYRFFLEGCNRLGINNIDFNRYFMLMKDTASWPLYPQYGIHWSIYGMSLCADSLFRYIEKLRGISLPDFGWDSLEVTSDLRDTDYDIGESLNLLARLKTREAAYPRYFFRERPGDTKPDVLVIADSFYWTIFGNGISGRMFDRNTFWFYFEQSFTGQGGPAEVKNLDVAREIESHQVVILMSSESNLYRFPFGFLEKLYPTYFPQDEAGRRDAFSRLIRWDKGWLQQVSRAADSLKIPLTEQIAREAALALLYGDSLEMSAEKKAQIIRSIRSDPSWMAKETRKAAEKNISVELQLEEDAAWIFRNSSNNYRRKYWPE